MGQALWRMVDKPVEEEKKGILNRSELNVLDVSIWVGKLVCRFTIV